MPQPWTHYFDVTISVSVAGREELDFAMPVWTPGSYLVREYARNVQEFSAVDGSGTPLAWSKASKNTWRVRTAGAAGVTVRYRVHAFESSVRTSFLDDSHASINGASVFMYVEGLLSCPHRLKIEPYTGWNRISTGLEPADGDNRFLAVDYDTLVDCPIEIGNHSVHGFSVRDVSHLIALYGTGNCDPDSLRADLQKIVETAAEFMGEIPYKHYTFLIQLLAEGGGGLEHANSASLIASRWAFKPQESYVKFLGLVSHEFFHVWNVKRIRPRELGPFDYGRENYTRMLWEAEGFTDYYGDLILRRAGLITPRQYLEGVSKTIEEFQEAPGRLVECVADASFDAWIKFYRQDPNFPNSSVSYYVKGCLIALVLDLELRHRSAGARSLDDVMRLLYRRYYKELHRGLDEAELRQVCEEVAGGPLNEIFDEYVHGTKEMDFARYLEYAGLKFAESGPDGKQPPKGWLGVNVKNVDGKMLISGILTGTPGYEHGLNVNDEIVAVDGWRAVPDTLPARIEEKAPGTRMDVLVSRAGLIRNIPVVLGVKKTLECRITKAGTTRPEQEELYSAWLNAPWKE